MFNLRDQLINKKNSSWFDLSDKVPIYGLLILAFCLFFAELDHIVEYIFFSLLIVWFLTNWKNETLQWVKTPLDIPILLYVVWALICVPFAVDQTYSFHEWRKAVARILLFFFVVHTVKTKQDVYNVLLAGAVGMGVLTVIESVNFFWLGHSVWAMNARAGGFSGNSQWFSVYLVIGLPLLWVGWRMARDNSKFFSIVWGIGLGVSFVGLFLAHTRSAWVAVAIQIFVYALLKIRNNWWLAFGSASLLFCVLLVLLSLPPVQQNVSTLSVFTDTKTLQSRFRTWPVALQDFSDHPLVGIGFGKHSFNKSHPDLDGGTNLHSALHNTFLARLIQIGLPGFLFFGWIFIVIMNRGSALLKSSDQFASKVALFTGLMVVGLIVINFFDDMFNGLVDYLFWLFIGLLFSVDRILKGQRIIGVT